MQKNDILSFLQEVNAYMAKSCAHLLKGSEYELNIIGKSALLLAGLSDSLGTKDVDLLRVEKLPGNKKEISGVLEKEFGRNNIAAYGFYLEFVSSNFALLPSSAEWRSQHQNFKHTAIRFLEPHYTIAAKLFSAYADLPRKQDKQDVRAALDQQLVSLPRVCQIADEIFKQYEFDARSDRFPEVYDYIYELMNDYGVCELKYQAKAF
jgi:hypothetical protein